MDREMLDDLLDASAPGRPVIDKKDLRLMLADARRVARPSRKYRRTAFFSGALALLLAGGAGVATAASGWLWGTGLENPDRTYSYTSATWGECEIRYSAVDTHDPMIQGGVDRAVDDWFANTDIEAAADPFVVKHLAALEAAQAATDQADIDPQAAEINEWTAHDLALQEAAINALKARGFDLTDLPAPKLPEYDSDFEEFAAVKWHSQLHCSGEDWNGDK
ncbi:hypothetical protein IWX78_003286 [Mycetocola sp. CAN_C7]|uniref:hypothetical protein n=1 Tax=Mycetocola sp. CAN_C7 TaxID=2787724 RepID=UPI0018CAEE98